MCRCVDNTHKTFGLLKSKEMGKKSKNVTKHN